MRSPTNPRDPPTRTAPNLSTLFSAARETLFMKRPKAAFLLSSGFYLADTMTLEGA